MAIFVIISYGTFVMQFEVIVKIHIQIYCYSFCELHCVGSVVPLSQCFVFLKIEFANTMSAINIFF